MNKQDILDYTEKETFVVSHGNMFPVSVIIPGILGVLLGLAIFFSSLNILGLLIFLSFIGVMIYISFTTTGTEFSSNTREVRGYVKSFFKKRGKWKNLEAYNDIAILSTNKIQKFNYGFVSVLSTSVKFRTYDVYLLGKNHWKKILVNSFDTKEEAKRVITKLVGSLNLNYTVYSPTRISKRRR